MGRLSNELINEIELICQKFNSNISPDEKARLYSRLEEIYNEYFVELLNENHDLKGS